MVALLSYYDDGPLYSYGAYINMVAGARGLGKTYGWIDRAIRDYLKNRDQFFYMRRYKEELAAAVGPFFDAHAPKYPFLDFRTNGGKAEVASAETRGMKRREWDIIGYFGALSTSQRFKSVPFPRVRRLGYDEVILEPGNTQYIKQEVRAFNNMYSTIDRYREKKGQKPVIATLMANSVGITNPYFAEWDINPEDGQEFYQRFKTTRNDGSIRPAVVVHLPGSREFAAEVRETGFAQYLEKSSPEYVAYAIDNQFADAHDRLIEAKSVDSQYRFTLETRSQTVAIWYDISKNRFYVTRKRPRGNEKIFTLERDFASKGKVVLEYGSRPLSALRTAFNHSRVWFDEPATRNLFLDIFKR